MNCNEIKKQIVQNLKQFHSGKWVNPAMAIMGVREPQACAMMNELVQERVIEQKYVHYNGHSLQLVRYMESTVRPMLQLVQNDE